MSHCEPRPGRERRAGEKRVLHQDQVVRFGAVTGHEDEVLPVGVDVVGRVPCSSILRADTCPETSQQHSPPQSRLAS
jgi:hypothetical protein